MRDIMRDLGRALLFVLFAVLTPAAHAQLSGRTRAVTRGDLCVTEGNISTDSANQLRVDSSKMRAYVNARTTEAIEARFRYLGGTAQESALGSGVVRRQFGLKLRAQNACNLVYVMWRFEPESKVVVSIKKNPGKTTSSECGNGGYQNIKPHHGGSVPALRPGEVHTLAAELHGNLLNVFVDHVNVWEGNLGPEGSDLAGPVGIRSDNARLRFDLEAGTVNGMHPDFRLACKAGPGVSD